MSFIFFRTLFDIILDGGNMKLTFKDGFKAAIPVMIGYIPVAMAFGILSRNTGLTLIETMSFSFILFAGASQFIGISMIAAGAGFSEIVLATFLLNFRHFFMSASLVSKLDYLPNKMRGVLGFGVTDEVFSVASFAQGQMTSSYLFSLELFSYLSWGIGTSLGFIVGNFLPATLQVAMGIGLFALFTCILVPELKKTKKAILLSLLAGLMNTFFKFLFPFPQGWRLVFTIIIVSMIGVLIFKEDDDE